MSALNLNILSPAIRERILGFKINRDYVSGEEPIRYSFDTSLDELPKKEDYNKETIKYYEEHDLAYFSTIDKHAKLNITDVYDGNVRRDLYPNQWDKRKIDPDTRTPDIYYQTDRPSSALKELWGQTTDSPYKIRQNDDIHSYIDYTNRIFGRNTPSSVDDGTASGSKGYNVLGAIIRGDGVSLAIDPVDNGIKVVTDFDIKQTLAGRIYSQASGEETPMGRFGLKAAAVSMANQMMAKTGQLVSGAVKEGSRWIVNNTVGRLFGGDGSDFDVNAFGSSRITNPPGFVDDILNATGLNRGLNAITGGLGLGFLLDGNNWSQTATSSNDGKYVKIDEGLLVDTSSVEKPDFNIFIDGGAQREGREYADGEEKGFFKRLFSSKNSKTRVAINEWEYRRLQQDVLVSWTGAMNARMIHGLLSLNKYSPGYSKGNSVRDNRRGVDNTKSLGYETLFPNNPYINPQLTGLPTIAELDKNGQFIPGSSNLSYVRTTVTWGESDQKFSDYVTQLSIDIEEKQKQDLSDANVVIQSGKRKIFPKRRAAAVEQGQKLIDDATKSYNDSMAGLNDLQYDLYPISQYNYSDGNYGFLPNNKSTSPLMEKTAKLFAYNKIGTMVSRFHKYDENASFIQTAIHPKFGMSKGRMLANKQTIQDGITSSAITVTAGGYEDPWCRVWSSEIQHRNILNAIRPFVVNDATDPGNTGEAIKLEELHKKIEHIRPYISQFVEYTSLQQSGTPKIAPYMSDFLDPKWDGKKENRYKYNRKYMFSIENLAWKGLPLENLLCPSQIGPNGGRIYWFSPLNLNFSESINVAPIQTTFIGRGEPMWSFKGSTERRGKLSFSIIVDHSSFHEYMEGRKTGTNMNEEEFYQSVLRFDAGCDIPNIVPIDDKTCETQVITKDREVIVNVDTLQPESTQTIKPDAIDLVTVFYPNDFSGVNWHSYTDETPSIVALKGLVGNKGGEEIMSYLYAGTGSLPDGKRPYQTGLNGDVGFGYEMKNDDGSHKVSISYNAIPKTSGDIYMRSLSTTGMSIEGILPTDKNKPKTYKGSETDFVNDFTRNMHVTDIIVPFYEKSYNKSSKILPRTKNEVLPRYQYVSFMSNWDIGNFELNSTKISGNEFSFGGFYEICMGKENGPHSDEFKDKYTKKDLVEMFNNAEKVEIFGNASKDKATNRDNKLLGRYRAVSLALFIIETLGDDLILHGDDAPTWVIKDEVMDEPAEHVLGIASSEGAKKFRHAHVKITPKSFESEAVVKKGRDNITQIDTNTFDTYTLKRKNSRYDEEMDFYEYIGNKNETDLTWSKIRDKYNKYIPALWSCTPEGFNARLTFLHQCTRSGPTNAANDNVKGVSNIGNLAFGRPPVCILKIGDFIQSKIFINNIQLSYGDEGIQWDLNPEGIGIQPMSVKVDMDIIFMGGQDITGAIARLQNAVSFNYYANTSVYDDRADGNIVDKNGNIVIDTTRKRGMMYTDGTSTTTTLVTEKQKTNVMIGDELVEGKPIYSQNPLKVDNTVKISDEQINTMNSDKVGLFNPYTYQNGRTYLDMPCPDNDKLINKIPNDGKEDLNQIVNAPLKPLDARIPIDPKPTIIAPKT